MRIWDAATGVEIPRLAVHRDEVRSAAFDDYDKRIVTASNDHTARIIDVSSSTIDGSPLHAILGANVCLRVGPLSLEYWRDTLKNFWQRPAPAKPTAPEIVWDPPNPPTRFEDIAEENLESYETAAVRPQSSLGVELAGFKDRE